MREAKDAGHETTAHLGGRFADFAVELGGLLDDQHARFRPVSLDQHRRRRARERTADNSNIVIEAHARKTE